MKSIHQGLSWASVTRLPWKLFHSWSSLTWVGKRQSLQLGASLNWLVKEGGSKHPDSLWAQSPVSSCFWAPSSLSSLATHPPWGEWLRGSWLHLTVTNLCLEMRGFITLGKAWLLLSTGCFLRHREEQCARTPLRIHLPGQKDLMFCFDLCRDSIEKGLPQTPKLSNRPPKGSRRESNYSLEDAAEKRVLPTGQISIFSNQLPSNIWLSFSTSGMGDTAHVTIVSVNWVLPVNLRALYERCLGEKGSWSQQNIHEREKPKVPGWNDKLPLTKCLVASLTLYFCTAFFQSCTFRVNNPPPPRRLSLGQYSKLENF